MRLIRDITALPKDLTVAVLVGLLAAGLPYGYLIGMIAGIICDYLLRRGIITLGTREADT
jgi:hypothetical protein